MNEYQYWGQSELIEELLKRDIELKNQQIGILADIKADGLSLETLRAKDIESMSGYEAFNWGYYKALENIIKLNK